jgi:hypothetical protein
VLVNGNDSKKLLEDMRSYAVEVSQLLKVSIAEGDIQLSTNFITNLVAQINEVHRNDREVQEPVDIAGSYNPPSGICYYFTETGQQLRKKPSYSITKEGKGRGEEFDNTPQVDDVCRKLFPQVSYGGWGYMYLLFCPIHGHCYGFHLIDKAEGRKDPFSAIFKYKPTAPKEMYYDFACQLNEYCLNREPKYWKKTRFWHDIFHGISHKCGACFKSTRICGMTGVNSEICEQFNSYMQCVKFTGSHLTQSHFMLFCQFMIYMWNIEKTKKFQSIATVALAGAGLL